MNLLLRMIIDFKILKCANYYPIRLGFLPALKWGLIKNSILTQEVIFHTLGWDIYLQQGIENVTKQLFEDVAQTYVF